MLASIFSLNVIQTALELGCIYGLVALALFLSYSILNIADLSTDGCFTLGCADTNVGACDRCQGMDVEELGSVHTHGGDCAGGHILGWNNKDICVIQAARYQMESDRYTVRLDRKSVV